MRRSLDSPPVSTASSRWTSSSGSAFGARALRGVFRLAGFTVFIVGFLGDLRRTIPQPQFAAALRRAEVLGLPLDAGLEPDHTRSELERRFLALCRRHRLPQPVVNARVGPFVVDFLWPGPALIAEVDGFRAHGGREAFESERARDAELKLMGYEVVRFTWRQLTEAPAQVATTLCKLLRRRTRLGATGSADP